ncbi:conserved hypothetical protein [Leishmania braziliensis MHOM/BR/75/M2904]|uniref:EF-hand domain-containing protein n=2 Tax=Leishmania braziliensis TaxID=5660 RepID=A4HGB2_LEIBR|nr:conserved hypothetical protein [Leishmania braziliensis MHOM/BR/75/M2904]CAJ2475697.1 unnamed protein product [Leishmania braziliensis]CAJ2476210.1 unnamed protein product [Leishmania braziliensis]CAM39604.1 conserved hypothetical protein [Leishmania braziliensis MHOM/BR/75/M2904]SYZ67263.1 SNARE_associated_Golgi_protein [Leishmania braziliensis MHOM/BR/75/M2904]
MTTMTSELERAQVILARERRSIGLVHRPIRTTLLFLSYSIRGVVHYTEAALSKRFFNTAFLPLMVILFLISYYVAPSPAAAVFSAFDLNRDGQVTAAEVNSYYTTVLKRRGGGDTAAIAAQIVGNREAISIDQFSEWWQSPTTDAQRYCAGVANGWWREVEYWLADALYWVVLGVLSSIGLGTGMHSGLLFLFPHIYRTCAAVQRCGNANFWTYPTNFFYGPRERLFVCITPESEPELAASRMSLAQYLVKVVPACMLWGAGTAMGEVPPYVLSYAAALQGRHEDDLQESAAPYGIMSLATNWTLQKVRRYGFWAILLLAAWPNMAYDLCGMACGQFLMPFSTFFSATLIGKAVIKVNLQAIFFIILFSGDVIERIMQSVGSNAAALLPAFFHVEAAMKKALYAVVRARESIAKRAKDGDAFSTAPEAAGSESFLVQAMHWFVVGSVVWFAKSIVESFARSEQERRDEDTILELELALRHRYQNPAPVTTLEFKQLLAAAQFDAQSSEGGIMYAAMHYTRLLLAIAAGLIAWGLYNHRGRASSLGFTLLLHRYLDHQLSANAAARTGMRQVLRVALLAAVLYVHM